MAAWLPRSNRPHIDNRWHSALWVSVGQMLGQAMPGAGAQCGPLADHAAHMAVRITAGFATMAWGAQAGLLHTDLGERG